MTTNKKTKYLTPTPGGAYYLVQNDSKNRQKQALAKLFSMKKTPPLTKTALMLLFGEEDVELLKQEVINCRKMKLLQLVDEERSVPDGNLQSILSNLIGRFSLQNKALLSDSQGFCLYNGGFSEQMSEEISVLSAEIAAMHERRAKDIDDKLKLNSQAWSVVDASGNSKLGFWPLHINREVFVLVIEGVPFFNQQAMVDLIWTLYSNYGDN